MFRLLEVKHLTRFEHAMRVFQSGDIARIESFSTRSSDLEHRPEANGQLRASHRRVCAPPRTQQHPNRRAAVRFVESRSMTRTAAPGTGAPRRDRAWRQSRTSEV